ncbi:hypothetical protein V8G54_024731 [Vigna mungo]|uniref:Peptidase C1A papain C-terminal domain-containing protein n=1 Tax=Vigna mungo TaxID=3915 RepID=A0AAQ3N7M3_VIGMU
MDSEEIIESWRFRTVLTGCEGDVDSLVVGLVVGRSGGRSLGLMISRLSVVDPVNGRPLDRVADHQFIINNGGIDSEEDYPYRGVDGTCDQYRKNAKVVSIDSYEDVNSYDELALKKAVANQPVSVAIEGGGREFQLYSSVSFQSDFIHDLGKGVPIA